MPAEVYVCPNCNSTDIYPLFVQDNIWKCSKCGFVGRPQKIDERVLDFWKAYLKVSSKTS